MNDSYPAPRRPASPLRDPRLIAATRHAAGGSPPRRGRGGSALWILLYGVLGLVALAASAGAVLLLSLPTDLVRERLAREVKARTGRDLTVGATSFTLLPTTGITLKDVSLSGLGTIGAAPLATMAALEVKVDLLPLIWRRVQVRELVMREPRIALEIDRDGRKSWEGHAEAAPRTRLAAARIAGVATDAGTQQPAPQADQSSKVSRLLARLENIALSDVVIDNGSVVYADARSGARQEIGNLNTRLAVADIASPIEAKGDLVWRGRKAEFDTRFPSLREFANAAPAKLSLSVKSPDANLSFSGTTSFAGVVTAEGPLQVSSPSARGLAEWAGVSLPKSSGFGALSLTGKLWASGSTFALTDLDASLDGQTAKGSATVSPGPARPHVNADLALSALNLDRYREDADEDDDDDDKDDARPSGGDAGSERSFGNRAVGGGAPPQESPGPRVKGYTKRAGWNTDPITIAPMLQAIDLDAKLATEQLKAGGLEIDRSEVTLALANGALTATLADMALYTGRGHGVVRIDAASAETTGVGADLTFEGIDARRLLRDGADFDLVAGRGTISLALEGRGRSEREIVASLAGKAALAVADGAIVGINIPKLVRSPLGESAKGSDEKTDFSELASSWTIAGGTARNDDLLLVSPLLRVTGAGAVLLPAREIDYTLRPKLVASLSGQGGERELSGIEVPVRVEGSWDKPKFKPDFGEVMKDPDKAAGTLKEIGKQFKGKKAGEIAEELFGDGPNGEKKPAKKLLEKFLGR